MQKDLSNEILQHSSIFNRYSSFILTIIMNRKTRKLLVRFSLSLVFCLTAGLVMGQEMDKFFSDIKNRLKNDPFKMSGGVAAQFDYNYIDGIDARRDPFDWRVSTNVTFDIIGIKAPFFAIFSDRNVTYGLPSYQFYGISPSYKWITLHLGDRAMNFSKYTMSNQSFYGTGLELKPGNFRFSTFYGTLKRITPSLLNKRINYDADYKRIGFGGKFGYETKKDKIELIYFKGKDDPSTSVDSISIAPAENAIISLNGKKTIGEKLTVAAEYARNALTNDVTTPANSEVNQNLFNSIGYTIYPKLSTSYHNAFNAKMNYKFSKKNNVGVSYERIDPNYRTLGGLYMNNDFENATLNTNTVWLEDKLSIGTNTGIQRNNLSGNKINSLLRLLLSIRTNYVISDQASVNASYSNFNSTNRVRALNLTNAPDSILLVQTTQNVGLGYNQVFGKAKDYTFVSVFSWQNANVVENEQVRPDRNFNNLMSTLTLVKSLPKQKFNVSASVFFNTYLNNNVTTTTFGPSISASKVFLDKLNTRASLAFNRSMANGLSANIFVASAQVKYAITKSGNIGLTLRYSNRGSSQVSNPSFTEFSGRLTMGYNFAADPSKIGGKEKVEPQPAE